MQKCRDERQSNEISKWHLETLITIIIFSVFRQIESSIQENKIKFFNHQLAAARISAGLNGDGESLKVNAVQSSRIMKPANFWRFMTSHKRLLRWRSNFETISPDCKGKNFELGTLYVILADCSIVKNRLSVSNVKFG